MGNLATGAFTVAALRSAWDEVLENDAKDGLVSPGIQRFQKGGVDANLTQLAETLAARTYTVGGLHRRTVQFGRKQRELHIPSVRDRIVARAMLDAVTPIIDPHLGPGAFAYRPGLGVVDAVQAVAGLRAEGLGTVLRTDIKDCFPNLPKALAVARFQDLVSDDDFDALLSMFSVRTFRADTGGVRSLHGVPQGCPLSPLLANLVLRDIDRTLALEGFPIVRYGDDILVATGCEPDAQEAARLVRRTVQELGMETNDDKTRITSFEEGFTFLGEDFGPRYPPLLSVDRGEVPSERAVYIGLQGAGVKLRAGRIKVLTKDDQVALDVPSTQVSRIVTFGSVGLSAGVRSWALENDVDVVMASRKGNYQGTLLSHSQRYRPARLRAQLAFSGSDRQLELAKAMVLAKIVKQSVILQRANRRDAHTEVARAIKNLEGLHSLLADSGTTAEVMGIEGAAARFYFEVLGQLVPEGLRFGERSRQPPQDLFNAALSYLYTILMGECVTALHAAGLEPSLGVLHSDHEKRASLALDLMEEFRPWLVDQVVLEAARQSRLRPEHGVREQGRGVLLTKPGKDVIVRGYEQRLLGVVRGALPGFAGSRRRHIYRQAQRLRSAIMDPSQSWTGLSWRP